MGIKKPIVKNGLAFIKPIPKSFIVLDFETSGFNPEVDKIIEVGAVRFTEGGASGDTEYDGLSGHTDA